MDSITQFVLGAAVSTVCLGRRLGPRKAALVGGLLGTVPDLDVLIPFDDPIDSFVYHRGWTHSVFVHALAAPLFGEVLVRAFKNLRQHRWLTYLTVYLCFATHALIDAMTVYGTRIFWPFYPDPVGVGSVFIIDPFYSLPLLAVVIWALFKGAWSQRFGRWITGVLVVSSCYLALSAGIQRHIEAEARHIFEASGRSPERIFAIAAPFNITLWKVIGLEKDRYQNLYISLFDGNQAPEIYEHPRHPELIACLEGTDAYRKLDWFSRGFSRAELSGNKVVVSDLRMGLTPGYAFRFEIADWNEGDIREIAPVRSERRFTSGENDLDWLKARLLGAPAVRMAEAHTASPDNPVHLVSCGPSADQAG